MNNKELNDLSLTAKAVYNGENNMKEYNEDDFPDGFKQGFQKAFKMILEKREEYGHGYLKGKLLDWMLELNINS